MLTAFKGRKAGLDRRGIRQKEHWQARNISYFLMLLILIAAFFGFTDVGILGKSSAGKKDSDFWVNYDRSIRVQDSNILELHASSKSLNSVIAIWVSADYLKNFYIKQITPQPFLTQTSTNAVIYFFKVIPANTVTIDFFLEPVNIGIYKAQMGLVDGSSISYKQFAYP